MSPSTLTALFILAAILVIAGYDLWVCLHYGTAATISDVTRRFGQRWPLLLPLLAFAMGCLYGHLFL